MIMLDTSVVLEILYGTARGIAFSKQFANTALGITSVTIYEVFLGAKEKELNTIRQFLSDFALFAFNESAAEMSASIMKECMSKGRMPGERDLFIAGICKSNDLSVVTMDKDFLSIPGLYVQLVS